MINITSAIYHKIKKHSLDNTNECCGFIIKNRNNIDTYPCINFARNSHTNFTIHPVDYIAASLMGDITASYHSHKCSESFSNIDKINSSAHQLPYLIYVIDKDRFKFYLPKETKFEKYLGIKFEYGKNDCLTMLEDFYINEFNIQLPYIKRDELWYDKNKNIIDENIENFGLNIINDKIKFGDIILVNPFNKTNARHIMIYIDNNQILHNSINSYSRIEYYNDRHKKHTLKILRHKNLC